MYKIIGADGLEYGPVTAEQLRQWLAEGRVNMQTRVQGVGSSEWKTFADFPELAGATAAGSPPPVPPPPARPNVPNYLVQSILATLFCCLPFGIVAIVYAAQVNTKLAGGDTAGALTASANAKKWCWASVFGWVAVVIVYVVLFALFAVRAPMMRH